MSSYRKRPPTHIFEFKKLIINRSVYEIGESISINQDNEKLGFGRIVKIWRNPEDSDAFIKISWYYRPDEVFIEVPSFISEAELFDSNSLQDVSVMAICEKINVMSFKKYYELDEVEGNTYFTRAFYDPRTNKLKPAINEWERLCYCQGIVNPDFIYLRCEMCSKLFHFECANPMTEGSLKWLCLGCCN